MENQDMVSVYTVNSAAEAEMVRGALEAVGIPCSIGGETQAGLAGVLQIDILTAAENADRARKELRLLRKEKKERHKAHIEKRKAKAAAGSSDAIQELKPKPPSLDIKKKRKEGKE